MFGKNKNKKVGLCVMVVTSCFILAGLWAVLATTETALAHKDTENPDHSHGGGGGGGKDKVPTCVLFDDVSTVVEYLGSVMGDQGNAPYFHNKKENITVKFSHDGHLVLNTNSTDKAGNGRGIFIDFGTDVTIAPDDPDNTMVIQTTDEALADVETVLGVSAKLIVGAHQEHEFDFLNMPIGGVDDNVNLRILVWFYFKDGSRDHLFIRLDPDGTYRTCTTSDSVTVTRLPDDPDGLDGLRMWRVETQPVVEGACISRSSDCDESKEGCLLDDVNDESDPNPYFLAPGHIALSFGFTVTAAP